MNLVKVLRFQWEGRRCGGGTLKSMSKTLFETTIKLEFSIPLAEEGHNNEVQSY